MPERPAGRQAGRGAAVSSFADSISGHRNGAALVGEAARSYGPSDGPHLPFHGQSAAEVLPSRELSKPAELGGASKLEYRYRSK